MRTDIGTTLGNVAETGKLRKPGAKHRKRTTTCAGIFWDFMLQQVRSGLLSMDELMASAMGALKSSGGSSECGSSSGGSGAGASSYGYTGHSPPALSVAAQALRSMSLKLMLAVMLLVAAWALAACGSSDSTEDPIVIPPHKTTITFTADDYTNLNDLARIAAIADSVTVNGVEFKLLPAANDFLGKNVTNIVNEKLKPAFNAAGVKASGNGNFANVNNIDELTRAWLTANGYSVTLNPIYTQILGLQADSTRMAAEVRAAVEPALTQPNNITMTYWGGFDFWNIPRGTTFADTVNTHKKNISVMREVRGDPLPYNNETLSALYNKCVSFIDVANQLDSLRIK